MNILHLIILCAATWRISSMLVNEDGPLFVLRNIREKSGIHFVPRMPTPPDPSLTTMIVPGNFLGGVLSCIWCCSVWVGIFLATAYILFPDIVFWSCLPFFMSSIAILIDKRVK